MIPENKEVAVEDKRSEEGEGKIRGIVRETVEKEARKIIEEEFEARIDEIIEIEEKIEEELEKSKEFVKEVKVKKESYVKANGRASIEGKMVIAFERYYQENLVYKVLLIGKILNTVWHPSLPHHVRQKIQNLAEFSSLNFET